MRCHPPTSPSGCARDRRFNDDFRTVANGQHEANTVSAPPGGFYKDKIGVIKRPVFDEGRWDGSDLFVVPQDPSTSLFCTERFVANWKQSKLKGALFSRFLMDPEAIKC